MTSRNARKIRVVTLNCRDDGWVSRLGRHDVDSVVTAVDTLGPAPDILCLPSMAGLGLDSSATLQALTEGLNELLDDGQDCFYPVWSDRARSRSPFGLWLRIPRVHARADSPVTCHPQAVSVTVAGVRMWIRVVRWPRERSWPRAQRRAEWEGRLSTVPALLLGDFATSFEDEHRSDINFNALKLLLENGFWDTGRADADLGSRVDPNTARALDHILVSNETPAQIQNFYSGQLEGSYPGVACTLVFATQHERKREQ